MKAKKLTKNQIIILLSIVLFGIIMIVQQENETPAGKRKKEIASQFSPFNGECYKLTELIKSNMNDPNSYENLETKFWDIDTAILVNQSYTGKNKFGGRVRGFVKAIVSNSGEVEIIESR
jgi:hypothetical protein